MREYLFRGKSLNSGKWVYGYFARLCHYLYENDRSKDRYVIIPVDSELYPRNEISYLIEVYPETVGQWTGLVDKNGVKIFEDDVVADPSDLQWTIAFENEAFVCLSEFKSIQYTLFEHHEIDYKNHVYLPLDGYYVVVGNKWEVEND